MYTKDTDVYRQSKVNKAPFIYCVVIKGKGFHQKSDNNKRNERKSENIEHSRISEFLALILKLRFILV